MTRPIRRCGRCAHAAGVYATHLGAKRVVEIRCGRFGQAGGPERQWNRANYGCGLFAERGAAHVR